MRTTLGALVDLSEDALRPLPPSPEGTRRTATLIHSSGSTGEPKGAILTEATLMRFWSVEPKVPVIRVVFAPMNLQIGRGQIFRSEEHTSELQSLMRISYAVFCLKKKRSAAVAEKHRGEEQNTEIQYLIEIY